MISIKTTAVKWDSYQLSKESQECLCRRVRVRGSLQGAPHNASEDTSKREIYFYNQNWGVSCFRAFEWSWLCLPRQTSIYSWCVFLWHIFSFALHKTQTKSRFYLKIIDNLLTCFVHLKVKADRKAIKFYSEQKPPALTPDKRVS